MVEISFMTMRNPEIAAHGTTLADVCHLMPDVSRLIVVPTLFSRNALALVRMCADRFPGEVVPGCMMSFDAGDFRRRQGGYPMAEWIDALAGAARNHRRLYFDFETARNRLRKDKNRFSAESFVRQLPASFEDIQIYPSPLNTDTHDDRVWLAFLQRAAKLRPEIRMVDLSPNGSNVGHPWRRRYRRDSLRVVGGEHGRVVPLLQFSMTDPKTAYWWYPKLEWGLRYAASELGHSELMVFCLDGERLEEGAVWINELAASLKGDRPADPRGW